MQTASDNIVKLQLALVEKLSAKATALEQAEQEGGDASDVLDSIDKDVQSLELQIASAELRQVHARAATCFPPSHAASDAPARPLSCAPTA